MRTTHLIDLLPAIPTQDWVTLCAESLTAIADRCVVVSIVCSLNHDSDRVTVISTGVAMGSDAQEQVARDQRTIALQDRIERLSRHGLKLPQNTLEDGLVAPLSALDADAGNTPIWRAFNPGQLHHPLLHIVPINPGANGLALLSIVGFDSSDDLPIAQRSITLLSALHQPLLIRARNALTQVNNPRAWLTDREQGVLDLLIEGRSVRVIAEQLERSSHTVHDHVKNLHKKIGASSRGELIAKALGYRRNQPNHRPVPEPVILQFPGDQLTEVKPSHLTARPLRS